VVRWAGIVAVIVAFTPHLAWAGSFVVINWRFAHDREALQSDPTTPDYYRKTLAEAGRWVHEHVEPGATILSRWKEVALETPAHNVIDVDPQMTPDNFDRTIRDYDVRFVVSVVWQTGVRENETQIEYSSRYSFIPVHRVGTVEILRVEPRSYAPATVDTVRSDGDSLHLFRTALRLLRRGDPVVAESLLVAVERRMGRYASIVYQQAVARALAGNLDEAMYLFERVRSIPQAGSILQQAWYHQEIITRLRTANAATTADERARGYHLVAINYWELGFRGQAFRMIDSALGVQPKFFPALIFGAIFRYQDGSIDAAEALLAKAEAEQPVNPLVMTMQDVLTAERARRASNSVDVQAAQWQRQAKAFTNVDMREDAIDAWRGLLLVRPDDPEALRGLTILMGEKRRFGPALGYARRWVAAMPNDAQAIETMADLERRWQ
jgi:tetratricopeptide (TPR) repeat protein